MIRSKQDLKEYIQADNDWLLAKTFKDKMVAHIANYPTRVLKKYLSYL